MIKLHDIEDVKYLCENYLWKGKGVLNYYAEMRLDNPIEKGIVDEFRRIDPAEAYLHIESIPENAKLVTVWPIGEWRTSSKREYQRKAIAEKARRMAYIEKGILVAIMPLVKSRMPMVDGKMLEDICKGLVDKRTNIAMQPVFTAYGIKSIEEIEASVVKEFDNVK